MSKLKILFSEPLLTAESWGKFSDGAGNNTFPFGVASIAAFCIKNGFEDVHYVEPSIQKLDSKTYVKFLHENKFDLVCMSSTTTMISDTIATFNLIKKTLPNSITILGGIHGTLLPQETLEACLNLDIIVLGEGELTFIELLKAIENKNDFKNVKSIVYRKKDKILSTELRNEFVNLIDLPLPAFNLFPMKSYVTQPTFTKKYPTYTTLVSRGCPYKCNFCNATEIHGRKVRYRSVDQVIKELILLKKEYDARGIVFMDSTFTVNKNWVREFCNKIIEIKLDLPWMCFSRCDTIDEELLLCMKKAGCWALSFGVESGNQKSLDLINKGTTVEINTNAVNLALKLGFFVYATYIICLPGEDYNDALNTINYAKSLGAHIAVFYLPIPFPKTKLFDICFNDGGLSHDIKWSDYNMYNNKNLIYVNPKIGKEKMLKLYKMAFRSYYLNSKVIYRNLKMINDFDMIKKYFYAAKAFFGVVK